MNNEIEGTRLAPQFGVSDATRINQALFIPDNQFAFSWNAVPGSIYQVQATPDLLTPWQDITPEMVGTNQVFWQQEDISNFDRLFFKVKKGEIGCIDE